MRFTLATAAAALASSALAIQVTSPTQYTVWSSSSSSQTISWTSVNTDASSFAIVLVNQDRGVLPNNDVPLASNVSTSAGSTTVTYPSGTWPVGFGFQVNLIQDANNINTIYAQSGDFNISGTASSVTTTSISGTPTTLTASGSVTLAGSGLGASNSASGTASGDTLPNASPSSKSGAERLSLNGMGMGACVVVLALLGSLLA